MFLLLGSIASAAAATPAADEVQRWIRQLGADGFPERQAAYQRLLDEGPGALPLLQEAVDQGDPEVRLRAARLVDRLRMARFEVLLGDLLSTPPRPAPPGLPAWDRYAVITGDGVAARRLYADMLRSMPDLLQLLDQQDPRIPEAVQSLIGLMQETTATSALNTVRRVPPEQIALLALFSIEEPAANHTLIPALFSEWLHNAGLTPTADESAAEEPLRRLASAWVLTPHVASRSQRMALAFRFGLSSGLEPAREILFDPLSSLGDKQSALMLIARFGGIEHVPDLEPLLSDTSELSEFRRRREIQIQSRMQDVALLTLVHVTGQDPAGYGFAPLQSNPLTVYSVQSIGFVSDEARSSALGRWRTWRAIHLQSPLFSPLDAIEGHTL